MTLQLPPNNSKYRRYLKIALSIAVIMFSAFAAALFGAGNDFSIAFLVVASASFAAFLLVVSDYVNIAVICGGGLLVAGVLSRNMTAVLWSFAYMPGGWIIFHSLRQKAARTTIVVRIAVVLGVFYALLIVGNLAVQHGSISPAIVFGEIDRQVEVVAEAFRGMLPVNLDDPDAEVRAALMAEEFVINLRLMVPMIFVTYCLAIAYFVTAFYRILYNAVLGIRESRVIKRKDWRIHLSWVSALIMIACSIVYMAVYADHSTSALLTAVIVSNIRFILTPGFCVMGIYFLFDKVYGGYNRYREPPNRFVPSLMLFGACVFVFLFLWSAAIAILAVFGIYAALVGEVKKVYIKARKLVTDDDDDDSDNNDNDNNNNEEEI